MSKREVYKNPRKYVKDAVVLTLLDEIERNGSSAPRDLVEEKADNILIKYEQSIVKADHSYVQVIKDGFLTNFLWWLSVVIISIFAFLREQESIKSAFRDLIIGILDK